MTLDRIATGVLDTYIELKKRGEDAEGIKPNVECILYDALEYGNEYDKNLAKQYLKTFQEMNIKIEPIDTRNNRDYKKKQKNLSSHV